MASPSTEPGPTSPHPAKMTTAPPSDSESPDSLAPLLSSITLTDGISLRAFSAVVRTARAKISDINTDLELVAGMIRAGGSDGSDDAPGPQDSQRARDSQRALEMLRGVQGAVELMAVSIGAMNEALCRIEARHEHAGAEE